MHKHRLGWIRSIRKSKSITFCSCTDGTDEFQITLNEKSTILGFDLKVGCSFCAWGEDSTTPTGSYEFLVSELTITGSSDDDFPIQPKEHTDDFLRTIPELRGRTLKYSNFWKIRSVASDYLRKVLNDSEFWQYTTPIITTADCEGAGETFTASSDWMNESLTVSGQLQLEVGMMSLGKVYNISPCFRAEKSATRKHLAEFWMLEAEAASYNLEHMIELSESMIKKVVNSCKEDPRTKDILSERARDDQFFGDKPWVRMHYVDVCDQFKIEYGSDISTEIEKKLVDMIGGPIFITHYPEGLKPFYMRKVDGKAFCFDLIFPEVGELIGGSERESDYDVLKKNMIDSGVDLEKMQWYLDLRKWGTVPHSGFGMGIERLIMYLTGSEKVHDVIPFPVSY